MDDFKLKLINELKDLIEILDKENIWYSAEAGTLLGAVRESGFIDWDDDIDLMIRYEGYEKLKKLYPDNILSSDDKGYPFLFPKWVSNKKDFDSRDKKIAIDLFLLVPTNEIKYEKWKSFSNKINFSIQVLNKSKFNPFSMGLKILKLVQWFLVPFFRKKITIENSYKQLLENDTSKQTGHVIMVNPTDDFNNKLTIIDNYKTKKVDFENIKINVVKDPELSLEKRYGKSWNIPTQGKFIFEHLDAISVKRIKGDK